ncbi:hypothetical protein Tco_0746218 [Tanacetum coccineum]|uniref:Uncharacterized protein n=1 Tax=Tanacetum coccineum TaxID=301880 RepID=A0ABQ5G6C1_9ASTR
MVINSPCLIDKKELAILGKTATGKELSNPLMADSLLKTILLTNTHIHILLISYTLITNMDFCDKHNMVAFLQKLTGSEEFHQIVDFLASSHIRRHLQLADADGISSLPNTEIFEQLTLMGQGEGPTLSIESQHTPIASPSTSQPTPSQPISSPT